MLFYFLLFIGFFLVFILFHLISYYLFEYFWFKKFSLLSSDEKRSSQHEFTSTIAVIGIFICYAIGSLNLYSSIETRWTETDSASYIGIMLTLGYTVYEEILYLLYKKELIYHIHHLLACIITVYSCIYPRLHFFICWGGTVEITGIFVNLFLLSKRFKISTTIVNVYGFLMWLSFLIFRFISLILMFLVIFLDLYYNSKYSLHLVSVPYLLVCGISAFLLFSMSIFWLFKITMGLVKVLFPKVKNNQVHPSQSGDKEEDQFQNNNNDLNHLNYLKIEINKQVEDEQNHIEKHHNSNHLHDTQEQSLLSVNQDLTSTEKQEKRKGDDTHLQSGDIELGPSE